MLYDPLKNTPSENQDLNCQERFSQFPPTEPMPTTRTAGEVQSVSHRRDKEYSDKNPSIVSQFLYKANFKKEKRQALC